MKSKMVIIKAIGHILWDRILRTPKPIIRIIIGIRARKNIRYILNSFSPHNNLYTIKRLWYDQFSFIKYSILK